MVARSADRLNRSERAISELAGRQSAHTARMADPGNQTGALEHAHGTGLVGIDDNGVLRLTTDDEMTTQSSHIDVCWCTQSSQSMVIGSGTAARCGDLASGRGTGNRGRSGGSGQMHGPASWVGDPAMDFL